MKTTNVLKLAIPALMLISGSAFAQITGTAHDMTAASTYDNPADAGAQICVYCHTPHNATALTSGPLWNRNLESALTFTMYNGAGAANPSTTIDGVISATPNDETMACLGCHDGVSAIDNISNLPGNDPAITVAWNADTNSGPVVGFAVLDSDLSDDHPVSITYSPADGGLKALATVTTADNVKFYGTNSDSVECASCHDVHGTGIDQFLRVTSDGSLICFECHDK